uniref:Myosin_tail_1 domain-containing protein n=1 Tax=Echinostoma caproni TaxID=27848 RepID=A0A183AGZ5_9TREM
LVDAGWICHTSGNSSHPFIFGSYFYTLLAPDLKGHGTQGHMTSTDVLCSGVGADGSEWVLPSTPLVSGLSVAQTGTSGGKFVFLVTPHCADAASHAQISETDFYDRLVEIRRESEIEIAKLLSRKNAELAAVQRNADEKHAELKAAIDKLEEQLAMAIANAEKVRSQSEEQSTQLQLAMTKQLDTFFEQSAQQKEELIREHEEKLQKLAEARKQDLEQLNTQLKRTEALEQSIQEERSRSDMLQLELSRSEARLKEACERQTDLQSSLDSIDAEMKAKELQEIRLEHSKQLSEWRSRAELARKQIKQLEIDLGETKGMLTKEVEMRRQQLSEIGQAREFERREWKRQNDEQMKRIAQEQEVQIRELRTQFVDDVQTTVSTNNSVTVFSWNTLLCLPENYLLRFGCFFGSGVRNDI